MISHIFHFSIMDLQMENQLFQGNKEASIPYYGSPNGEPTVTRKPGSVRFSMLEIQYFSEWYLIFHFSIMDLQMENQLVQLNQVASFSIIYLQMENQLFQGNQAAWGSPLWRSISWYHIFLFSIMDLQIENNLVQGNQAALGSPLWRSITLVNDIL